MTKEELREHCEKQVKMCEEWAKGNDREPSGKIYEEHKLILDLIKALEQEEYYKNLAQSYEKTINKLTKAIAEQQPSEDCVSRQAVKDIIHEYKNNIDSQLSWLSDGVCNLPPVTPIHGTCKDCSHRDPEDKMCDCGHFMRWLTPRPDDWYCADYLKRGSENE